MSKTVSKVKAIVEDCLKKLVKHYEEQEEDFLTEGDVASSLFCMLKDEMKNRNVEGFKVHVGLRPYKDTNLVLKAKDSDSGEWEWKKHEPKNSGAVVDIVIVEKKNQHFTKAKKLSPENYWRLVTYPLESFVVCIEVKIRVSGNMDRIEKDINELWKIRETKEDCLVYLLVVDRKISIKNIEKIKELRDKNNVPLFKAIPSDQT